MVVALYEAYIVAWDRESGLIQRCQVTRHPSLQSPYIFPIVSTFARPDAQDPNPAVAGAKYAGHCLSGSALVVNVHAWDTRSRITVYHHIRYTALFQDGHRAAKGLKSQGKESVNGCVVDGATHTPFQRRYQHQG